MKAGEIGGYEQARAIFDEEQPGRCWQAWVRLFQTPPRVFVNDAKTGLVLFAQPQCSGPWAAKPDTWVVWYASGPIAVIPDYLPYPLPHVAWLRRKTKCLHFYRWERIRALTMNGAKEHEQPHGR